MKKKLITQGVTLGIVIAGASFYGGMQYGKSSAAGAASLRGERFAQNGAMGGRTRVGQTGGGFVAGEVVAKDSTSVTIKLPDGGSRVIFLSASTRIAKAAEGTLGDIAVGESVTVGGAANADGSITAQTIQIRPASSTLPGLAR